MNDISVNTKNIYWNSAWFSIKDTMVASFLTVYLLRLHVSNYQLSLYEVIPACVAILTLLLASTYFNNSRKHFLNSQVADRLGFLIFVALLFFIKQPLMIIVLYGLYSIPLSICSTLSGNYIKESVPKEKWGSVFSTNKMILVSGGMITLFTAGWILDNYRSSFPYNFIWIFFIVGIFYIFSFYNIKRIKADVKDVQCKLGRYKMLGHIDRSLLIVLLAQALIYIASPLWSIFHVKILELSNFQISMLGITASISGLIVLPFWGKLLDRFSNKKLFVLSLFLLSIIPIIYTLNRSYYYLIFAQFIIGIISNGYDVILQNNLMANSQQMRYDYIYMANCQIYFNVVRMIFPALGILLYSQVGILNAFLIIGGLRICIAIMSFLKMKEISIDKTEVQKSLHI